MNEKGAVNYMNSGDWIENLTTLEYNDSIWEIYTFNEIETSIAEVITLKNENRIPRLDVLSEEVALLFHSISTSAR